MQWIKERMNEWMNEKFDLQILNFCYFKLSEKFAEKQKYEIFFSKQR